MTSNRFVVRRTGQGNEPKIGRMIVVSVLIHLLVVVIAAHKLFPEFTPKPRPVYYVDLAQKPITSPKKGLPQQQAKTETKVPTKPIQPKQKPIIPKKAVQPEPPAIQKSSTEKKKTTPTVLKDESIDVNEEALVALQEKISGMRSKNIDRSNETSRAIEKIRRELEELTATGDSTETPLGSESGTGEEPGVDEREWIEAYLKKMWRFSRYQIDETRIATIKATVELEYNSDGTLKIYTFIDRSGDALFDDSVKAAIIKGKQLDFNPGRKLKFIAHFNLKDLNR